MFTWGSPWSVCFKGKVPAFTSESGPLVPENLGFPTVVRWFPRTSGVEKTVCKTRWMCLRDLAFSLFCSSVVLSFQGESRNVRGLLQFPWSWFFCQFAPFRERLIVRYISTLNHVLRAVPDPTRCRSMLRNEWGLAEVGLIYSRRRSHQKSMNELTLNYMRKRNLDKRSGILRNRYFWDLLSGSRIK